MRGAKWVDRAEYPFDSHFVDTPAGRLHFVDEGVGRPILLVHGNPTWSFLYRNLIKRLSVEYRCIAVDHIGFGLSDKPVQWSYLPEDHVRNLAALIDALRLTDLTLVLHDWGGPIGIAYALGNPGTISRIILMNTWAWPVNHNLGLWVFSRITSGALGRSIMRRYNFLTRLFMPIAFYDKSKLTPLTHSHYMLPLEDAANRKACMEFPRQILKSGTWLADIWRGIGALQGTPMLYIWGMKDLAFSRRTLRKWEQTFPEATFVRLSTVGHFVPEEAPDDVFREVSSFLRLYGGA